MTGIQCIIIILFVRVIQQYTSKNSSMLAPSTVYGNAKYFSISKFMAAAFAAILLVIQAIQGNLSGLDMRTFVYAAISGVMLAISSICGLYAIRGGTMALSSMFGTAGLIVPCVAGIFLYDQKMSVWQWVGVALFLVSSFLLIGAGRQLNAKFSFKTLLLLIGSLLSNGVVMMMQTMFSQDVENGNVTLFSFLTFVVPAVLLLLITGGLKVSAPSKNNEKLPRRLLIFALFGAAAVFVVNQLATMAAGMVQPVILFTFINGGNTIIAAVMAAVLFREKFTVKSVIGLVLGVGSLIIVKAFEPI